MSAITYRPATLDDAELAANLMTSAYTSQPQDPIVTRFRWETRRQGFAYARFIAERDGSPIAFVSRVHLPSTETSERHAQVDVSIDPRAFDRQDLSAMWTWIADQAIEDGARLLLAYSHEDDPETLGVLAALGYYRERIERVWELDLRRHGPRLAEEAADAKRDAAAAGIELTTLDAWRDPGALRKLHELDEVTRHDIPTTVPIPEEAYEDFVRRSNAPDRRADRTWIALEGDSATGLSYLRFPPVRGRVWTGYTCTRSAYRGRGLARAVKLQSLAQAVELGVDCVMTANDSENAPMLHINEKLGYVRRPGFVEHHKRVTHKGG